MGPSCRTFCLVLPYARFTKAMLVLLVVLFVLFEDNAIRKLKSNHARKTTSAKSGFPAFRLRLLFLLSQRASDNLRKAQIKDVKWMEKMFFFFLRHLLEIKKPPNYNICVCLVQPQVEISSSCSCGNAKTRPLMHASPRRASRNFRYSMELASCGVEGGRGER